MAQDESKLAMALDDNFHGVRGYVRTIGVSDAAVDSLRSALLKHQS